MPRLSPNQHSALAAFLAPLADVHWLATAGEPHGTAIVADDLVDGWESWNSEMLSVWLPETNGLEQAALATIGDVTLTEVFDAVSCAVDAPLRTAMEHYFNTRSTDVTNSYRGLWPEWLDAMKRDLCWAAVEAILGRQGFFTGLLDYYRAGRWPCAWENGDRAKRVVLL